MDFDKGKLHHIMVSISKVKLWQLVLLFVFLAAGSVYMLRQNSLNMIERKNLVKQADEQNGDVKKALAELQRYVSSHMNTNMGEGVFLESTYQRAYNEAVKEASSKRNPNKKYYDQAHRECGAKWGANFRQYTLCAHERLSQLAPAGDALAGLKAPDPELYRYKFVSPQWSFDVAGFFVLATVVTVLVILGRMLSYFVLYLLIRYKHK